MFAELAPLSLLQIKQLERHYELLIRWNKILNLTSVRDPKEIIERHYGESLFLGKNLPSGPLRIADVGSGAGFPGIPVGILRPESFVWLIESHQRKSVFLQEATREINNIQVIAQRAENITEQFDWVVSRAVKHPPVLADNLAFLGGEEPPVAGRFTWNKVKIPFGDHRFLWLGRST